MENKILGNMGEALAFNYLVKNKYKILEKNFSCCIGEIDLIAQKDDMYVFVEVKCRTTKKFGLPREAVTPYKQNKIKQVAKFYLQKVKGFDKVCRFDVIEVLDDKIEHIKNAFV